MVAKGRGQVFFVEKMKNEEERRILVRVKEGKHLNMHLQTTNMFLNKWCLQICIFGHTFLTYGDAFSE